MTNYTNNESCTISGVPAVPLVVPTFDVVSCSSCGCARLEVDGTRRERTTLHETPIPHDHPAAQHETADERTPDATRHVT